MKTEVKTEYYDNGEKELEGNYKDGKKEGLWTDWDEEGKVTKTETYKLGRRRICY